MGVRIVEGQLPYTGGTGIEIDGNKVISLLLREENNLILVNDENEVYTDLQLESGLTPQSDFPVGITVGKVLQSDGWTRSGLVLNWKTTSGDYARWIYATDGKLYFDNGTGTWKQVYYSSEVDELIATLNAKVEQYYSTLNSRIDEEVDTLNDRIDNVEDSIPAVIDNLNSTSTTDALSAKQGRVLKDMISSASGGLGRFLSLWNSETGQPISFPLTTPYTYGTGDWFLVEVTGTTNYKPTGSTYTGTASGVVDSATVEKGDVYIYDGTEWLLQKNTEVEVSFSNIAGQPTDNTNLASALNAKADDSAVVHISGTETITGAKTFGSQVKLATASIPATGDNSNYVPSTSWVNTAISSGVSGKQDTLTAGANIQINGTTISATDTTYTAGEGIEIGDVQDYSAMQGPAPTGFHVPSKDEWVALCGILTTTFGMAENATTMGTYLKMPMAGLRGYSSSSVSSVGAIGYYWSSSAYSANYAYLLRFDSSSLDPQNGNRRAFGFSVRCFKDVSVIPDNSWTTLYDGSSVATGAGIFYSATEGLISISTDGTNWTTIQDKNLGATTVYNNGDTLTDDNCGNFYQWGNNYGFPHSGTVTTSSTQVDASSYGPGNYYSSSTFITGGSDWSSVQNDNLWGGVTGVVTLNNVITNTQTSAEWGNITGTLADQTDLNTALDDKADSADVNTKTFTLSSTSDLTTAQAIYDYYADGGNPIVRYAEQIYTYYNKESYAGGVIKLRFCSDGHSRINTTSGASLSSQSILIRVSGEGEATEIFMGGVANGPSVLITNYDNTFTPTQDGHPATKKYVDDSIGSTITKSTTAPSNPTEGTLWYDTTNDVLKVYNGTSWDEVGNTGGLQKASNSPLDIQYFWAGTQAQYEALSSYSDDTIYLTI